MSPPVAHGQYSDTPWQTHRPPYQPTLINLNQSYNMTANSLTEALLILSSMYLSLVHTETGASGVSLHTIFTQKTTTKQLHQRSIIIKENSNNLSQSQPYLNASLVFNYLTEGSTPRDMLHLLCASFFPKNAITVFFLNNEYGFTTLADSDAIYLRRTFEYLGLPVISYDTMTSERSNRYLTLELAPTLNQMMDAFFAFMKRFNWTDFSFICAMSSGCESAVDIIRNKVDESNKKYNISVFGVEIFAYRLLSYVNINDTENIEELTEKLSYELEKDTRIVLVHGHSLNVLTVVERAKELGLMREDYVWIFTLTAIGKAATDKQKIKQSYPVGSFVIGFDASDKEMLELNKDVHNMWFSALKMMAQANEFDYIDFQTRFTCDTRGRWPNETAPVLFWKYGEKIYKYLLKTKFADKVEFDDKGFLRYNYFWIKNIQPMNGKQISDKADVKENIKTFDTFLKPSSRPPVSFGQKKEPSFLFNRKNEASEKPRITFTRRPTYREQTAYESDARDLELNDTPLASDRASQYQNASRKYPMKYGSLKTKNLERNQIKQKQSGARRRMKRQGFTGVIDLNHLQTVATWNGHNLTVTGIVWPGGASVPPKGRPEKYVLKVVTWAEDPHVIYTEKLNETTRDQNRCESNAIPCTIYERDSHLQRLGNQTREVCCTGLTIDLLKRLSAMLSFDVELMEVPDGGYGSPINNNESDWTGMVGMMIHRKADIAVGALSITPERSYAVDFSMPFLQTGITIIVALREGAISPTAFLEPYDYPSWSLILLFSVHATGASIFIFEWLSPYGLDQGRTSLRVHKFSLFRSFWLIWAMLFGASVSTDQPRGCASRFLANIWALFAVVFCASYTANLAAFMITKDDYYDLSGIQDWRLKNPNHIQPPFKYATIANSSTDLNIAKNYKTIHDYMKNYAQTSVKDAIRALKEQKIQAFIYDSTTLEYEFGKDVGCKLKTVGKRIAETGYGLAFPKKSHWVKKVDKALLTLQEEGEIERLQKFWLAGACHKKKERGVSSHTLGILNFTSAFILLGAGVILGVLLLAMEHMYFRFGRKSLKKWDRCGCCSLVSLSMGQSLTFEQSVIEAVDYHKHHKCKDPLCETQLWKVKHELDIALLKISQLRRLLAHSSSLEAARDQAPQYKLEVQDSPQLNGNANRRRRQQKSDATVADKKAVRPLLALEGPGDTEEKSLLKPFAEPKLSSRVSSPSEAEIPLRNLKPLSNEDKSLPIYENKRALERDNNPRQNLGQVLNNQGAKKVADLDLHPRPPTFDEAVQGYSDTPNSGSLFSFLPPPLPPNVPGSIETTPSSDDKRYEPFILDSPESPSSTFSELSDTNRLPSPGDLSKLSDEGLSSPASPGKDSNFTSSPDVRNSQADRGGSRQISPAYSNRQEAFQRPQHERGSKVALKDKLEPNTTLSREDDNDVSARRIQTKDGNVYVNVDEVVGKETSF